MSFWRGRTGLFVGDDLRLNKKLYLCHKSFTENEYETYIFICHSLVRPVRHGGIMQECPRHVTGKGQDDGLQPIRQHH